MIIGVDYASVAANNPPDFARFGEACREAGSSAGFSVVRGSWGTYQDPTYKRDVQRAQNAGLVTGAYLFLRMPRSNYTATPEEQVDAFRKAVGPLGPRDLPPVIDVEEPWLPDTPDKGRAQLAWVERAVHAMEGEYGADAMIYTSARVWRENLLNIDNRDARDLASEHPLWIAKPWPFKVQTPPQLSPATFAGGINAPVIPLPWRDEDNWWIHQYQGDAIKAPGFSGRIDLNRFNVLREGARGARVLWLQRKVDAKLDQNFGPETAEKLRSFQKKCGLAQDAVVGPKTFAALCWSPYLI